MSQRTQAAKPGLLAGDRVQFTRYYYLHENGVLSEQEVFALVGRFIRYDGDKHAVVQIFGSEHAQERVRVPSIQKLGEKR